jgi:hypothetical protein
MNEWRAINNNGRTYYYNTVTLQTTWIKPSSFDTLQDLSAPHAAECVPIIFSKFANLDIKLIIHQYETIIDPTYKENINGDHPKLNDVILYCEKVLNDLFIYPKEFFKKISLKCIMLVSNLSLTGQKRRAIPNWHDGILYLDVSAQSVTYLQATMHHELFHMIDHAMMGRELNDDPEWESLNIIEFSYGTGGAHNRHKLSWISADDIPQGFLNKYSTTACEEDKAEIYAALIKHPSGVLCHKDEIIQRKGKELQKRLKSFCYLLDDSWWEAISSRDDITKICSRGTTWTKLQDSNGVTMWRNSNGGHSYRNPALFGQ